MLNPAIMYMVINSTCCTKRGGGAAHNHTSPGATQTPLLATAGSSSFRLMSASSHRIEPGKYMKPKISIVRNTYLRQFARTVSPPLKIVCKGGGERRRVFRISDGIYTMVGEQLCLLSDLFHYDSSESAVRPRDDDGSLGDGHFPASADAQMLDKPAGWKVSGRY